MAKTSKPTLIKLTGGFYTYAELAENPSLLKQCCASVFKNNEVIGFVGDETNPLILLTKETPRFQLAYVEVTIGEAMKNLEELMFRATYMQFFINGKVLLAPHRGDTRKGIALGKAYEYVK